MDVKINNRTYRHIVKIILNEEDDILILEDPCGTCYLINDYYKRLLKIEIS